LFRDGFIAHRGGDTHSDWLTGAIMPENSLAAFEQAATRAKEKQQNMVVETDADNMTVHDPIRKNQPLKRAID
jgi:glycerophosphoryl diester phosphodiesterase